MRRFLGLVIPIACGCGHAPPPRAASAEIPVTSPATIAGRWLTSDDLDWGYALEISADGRYTLHLERGKMGGCERRGRLSGKPEAGTFQLAYSKSTCDPPGTIALVSLSVTSFTGEALAVVVTGNGTEDRRSYQRDPRAPRPAAR